MKKIHPNNTTYFRKFSDRQFTKMSSPEKRTSSRTKKKPDRLVVLEPGDKHRLMADRSAKTKQKKINKEKKEKYKKNKNKN